MTDATGRLIAASIVLLAAAVFVTGFWGKGRYVAASGLNAGRFDTQTAAFEHLDSCASRTRLLRCGRLGQANALSVNKSPLSVGDRGSQALLWRLKATLR